MLTDRNATAADRAEMLPVFGMGLRGLPNEDSEPTALGRLKVRCYAEVPEQDEHLLSFPYKAIGWLFVNNIVLLNKPPPPFEIYKH